MEQSAKNMLENVNRKILVWRLASVIFAGMALIITLVVMYKTWNLELGYPQSWKCAFNDFAPKVSAALIAIVATSVALGYASSNYKSWIKVKIAMDYKLFLAKAFSNYHNDFSVVGTPTAGNNAQTGQTVPLVPGRNPALDLAEMIIENLASDPSKGL